MRCRRAQAAALVVACLLVRESSSHAQADYNRQLLESFLRKHASLFTACSCGYERRLDETAATVIFEFDFGPCPAK